MRRFLGALPLHAALLFLALVPSLAAAQPAADQYRRGLELYQAQRYEEAIVPLEAACREEPTADHLFVLAQALRLSGRCPEARVRYGEVLALVLDDAQREAVTHEMNRCPEEAPLDEPPPDTAEPEPIEPDAVSGDAPSAPIEPIDDAPWKRDVAGHVLLVLGGIGLGVGGMLTGLSFGDASSARDAQIYDDLDRLEGRAERRRIFGLATAGAGAALVVGAIVRYLRAPARVQVDAALGRDQLGVSLRGTF